MDIDKLIEAVRLCGSSPTIYQCEACAYYTGGDMGACIPEMTAQAADALSMLQVLQDENDRLHEQIEDARLEGYAKGLGELERVKRERNAAVEDLRVASIEGDMDCNWCAGQTDRTRCYNCSFANEWKWCGQKEE